MGKAPRQGHEAPDRGRDRGPGRPARPRARSSRNLAPVAPDRRTMFPGPTYSSASTSACSKPPSCTSSSTKDSQRRPPGRSTTMCRAACPSRRMNRRRRAGPPRWWIPPEARPWAARGGPQRSPSHRPCPDHGEGHGRGLHLPVLGGVPAGAGPVPGHLRRRCSIPRRGLQQSWLEEIRTAILDLSPGALPAHWDDDKKRQQLLESVRKGGKVVQLPAAMAELSGIDLAACALVSKGPVRGGDANPRRQPTRRPQWCPSHRPVDGGLRRTALFWGECEFTNGIGEGS